MGQESPSRTSMGYLPVPVSLSPSVCPCWLPQPLSFQRTQDLLGTFSCCCGEQVNTVPALSSKGLHNDCGLVPKFIKKKKRIYLQGKIVSALFHIFLHPYYLCLCNKYDKSRDRFSKIFSQLGAMEYFGS